MKLLWQFLKQHRTMLIGALALATVNQGFSLLDPQIFRLLIDGYANKATELSRQQFMTGILLLLGGSVGVAMVSRIAKNFQDYFVNVITQRVGTQLYAHAIAHSFSLPYAAFEDQRSGELLQKVQKAKTDAQAVIQSMVNVVFLSIVGVVFVLVYAFTLQWLIGLVYILIIPALGTITFVLGRKIKQAQKRIVTAMAELSGSTTETLRNVELVKSLGLEEQEIARLSGVNDAILQLELKKVRLVRTLGFVQGTCVNAMRSGLLLLMLWLIFQGEISLGEFFSLLFYSFFIFTPLQELGSVSAQYQEARASLEKLDEILKQPLEEKPEHPAKMGALEKIRFTAVEFTYSTGEFPSLKSIDCEVNSGQTVAFVGPSGSGKSTLVKLLVGLYKPTHGKLLVNGVDAVTIDWEDLRKRIGLVSQETQLFAGTIRENLLFVNPTASDRDCETVLRKAEAMAIIERGDKGLDTKIGEGGIKLSGGERQRLAIARALLRDPDLVIFDEATSSLDSITEKSITDTIRAVSKHKPGLITVLIAHRLSTVMHADVIFVLEKGKIIEQGNHHDLIQRRGLYAALWREQSGSL